MHLHRFVQACRRWIARHPGWLATALLLLMFALGATSMRNDSASFDEVAHIPAGYSYLRYGDFRLNPEHPPLLKDLAGLPLQFLHLKFPEHEPSWTTEMNGQWSTGRRFLYTIGNDADQILFWARLPILLLAVALGALLYELCRRRWGAGVALLAVFFYALSPNMLANARLVTTDVGASAFFFLVLVAFSHFVAQPRGRNVLWLGLALGAAQVVKFSAFVLYPFLASITLLVVCFWPAPASFLRRLGVYGGGLLVASLCSGVFVWLFYVPHTWNLTLEVQDRLINGAMVPGKLEPLARRLLVVNKWPLMKPVVQYVIGVAMVMFRVKTGTWTYFNGQIIRGSFRAFFPELFMVKTQVAFLILAGAALIAFVRRRRVVEWLARPAGLLAHFQSHFLLWSSAAFAFYYFAIAVVGNLNLGIRHILPIYVPLFILVAVGTEEALSAMDAARPTWWRSMAYVSTGVLLVWYAASTLWVHPAYEAYFNELLGGPQQADRYFADSSVDWGQDLRRLRAYVDAHPEIQHLAIDYFGGGEVKYYFCKPPRGALATSDPNHAEFDCRSSVYDDWKPSDGRYAGSYLAVSETNLARDPLFGQNYGYLRGVAPIAKIGYSIHLFKLR